MNPGAFLIFFPGLTVQVLLVGVCVGGVAVYQATSVAEIYTPCYHVAVASPGQVTTVYRPEFEAAAYLAGGAIERGCS